VSSLSASEPQITAAATAPAATEPAPKPDPFAITPERPVAVKVENVSVTYRTTFERTPTFKTAIVRMGRGERAVREVQALKDVSFQIPEGTALGIVGANGAGKSTLIRTLGGILPPTSGRIEVHGRISALLALGVGFNPNLSGTENVILGGLANGLSRAQVKARAAEIAEFAELGDFMDLPIRTYSSGMRSRLAFAVSVHMDPDILMIDEALSAGDASFKKRAAAKMDELMTSARAMFLVSHALGSIKELCNAAIWLHKGELMMQGTPDEVIHAYTKFLAVGEDAFSLEDL
jgi:ABC-type polysaccharide/polyol phosphate transport system ATPase subunit